MTAIANLDSLVCERRTYENSPHVHAHRFAQLVVPITGTLSITLDREELSDSHQLVIYIPPTQQHSFHSHSVNRFFVFDIPAGYISDQAEAIPSHWSIDERWRAIRTLLSTEVGDDRPAVGGRLHDLFRYMLALLPQPARPPSLDYLHDNFHRRLTIRELAAIEHYHPSYYCEWFQARCGVSPMDYQRSLRLQAARELLRHTDYTLLQIAQQVGYSQQSALTRAFREQEGMNPSEYRRNSRMQAK